MCFSIPARLFVECERIVLAPLRVLGCDPDVVGHVEILGGFVGLGAIAWL